MLYLEDYLEMIEHLPQELRDRFTEMRELDLTVQNNYDSLEKKTRNFFQQCKRGELLHDSADFEFHHLRKEYYKVMEDAEEKVAIATQIHELVERYVRRLDSELFKFKCELEADNNGITEILEKRSREQDIHNNTTSTALMLSITQKENRFYGSSALISTPPISNTNSTSMLTSGSANTSAASASVTAADITSSVLANAAVSIPLTPIQPRQRKLEKRRETICTMTVPEKRPTLNHTLPSNHVTSSTSHSLTPVRPLTSNLAPHSVLATTPTGTSVSATTPVTYNLQLGGAASSAIAAAASQAIVATQQMQQGRRTASLKASYEAIHGGAGVNPTEFWIANAANATVAAHNSVTLSPMGPSSIHHHDKKQKKNLKHHHNMAMAANVAIPNFTVSSSGPSITSSASSSLSADTTEVITVTPTSVTVSKVVKATGDGSSSSSGVAMSTIGLSSGAMVGNMICTNLGQSAVCALPSTSVAPGANITINENGQIVEQSNESEWPYDPNEPRYCTCNQVSYGDMVACDNDACPYEWFHYPCVGITQPPKGKWYCPKCTASMRRRGNRKN